MQSLTVNDEPGNHFQLGDSRRTDLSEADVILLRQDPPFDLAYITTTHLLERLQPAVTIVNDPQGGSRCAGENARNGLSAADAADADFARSRRN